MTKILDKIMNANVVNAMDFVTMIAGACMLGYHFNDFWVGLGFYCIAQSLWKPN